MDSGGGTVATSLVERERELGILTAAAGAALAGDGAVVLVEGVAGAGKTALLDAACREVAAHGTPVLRAAGSHLLADEPYGLVRRLLGRAARHDGTGELDGLLSAHGQFGEVRVMRAVHALLAGIGPVVLAADDVHWADDASLDLLARLVPRLGDLPVLMLVASRPPAPDAPAALHALLADVRARVTPQPLTRQGIARLFAEHEVGIDDDGAAACHAATGGNVFLVSQLAVARRRGDVSWSPGALRLAEPMRDLSRTLRMRVGRLGSAAVALARAAAVLDDGAPLRYAAALGGIEPEAAATALDALADAGILAHDAAAGVRFAHPIIRDAIAADLAPGEASLAHRRAARLLLDDRATPARVAAHLLHSSPAGDPETVDVLVAAGETAAAQGAPAVAARLLRRALEEPPAPERRDDLLVRTAQVELSAGEAAAAVEHAEAALGRRHAHTGPLPAEPARLLVDATLSARGPQAAVTVAAELRPHLAAADRAAVEAAAAWACYLDPSLRPELARLRERHPGLTGVTPGERALLAVFALQDMFGGQVPEREVARQLRLALGEGRMLAEQGPASGVYGLAMWAFAMCEDVEVAKAEVERAVAAARRQGGELALATMHVLRCALRDRLGDLAGAEADGLAVTDLLERRTETLATLARISAVFQLAHLAAQRGDVASGDALVTRAGLDGDLPPAAHRSLQWRARVHLLAGRRQQALADARRAAATAADQEQDPIFDVRQALALALAACGEHEEARELAGRVLDRAHRWDTPSSLAMATVCVAHAGPREQRVVVLREAVAMFEASPMVGHRASARLDLGIALRTAGRRNDARAALEAAVEDARACGAGHVLRRAHEELIVLGARPRRLAFSGADSLTASERRVCDLATRGLTNAEIAAELIVAKKTVEAHLRTAFRKLDIASRKELAAAMRG